MTAEEFLHLIRSQKTISPESDNIVHGAVKINQIYSNRITGVTFVNHVQIVGVNLEDGILFESCQFKSGIFINNCNSIETEKGSRFFADVFDFAFINSPIYSRLDINNCNLKYGFSILQTKKVDHIYITNNESIDYFEVDLSEVYSLSISKTQIPKRITIVNSEIKNSVKIKDARTNTLDIEWNKIEDDIEIDSIYCDTVKIHNNVVSGIIQLGENFVTQNLSLFDNTVSGELHLNIGKDSVQHIKVGGGNYGHGLMIESIVRTSLKSLDFSATSSTTGMFTFSNFNVDEIKIRGTSTTSSLLFDKISVHRLSIVFFFNYSTLCFTHLYVLNQQESFLEILSSRLGKTEFLNASLEGFDKVLIDSSSLVNVTSVQTKWFKPFCLYKDMRLSEEIITSKQEIFRQLKYAMEQQGDRIKSLEFKRLEMEEFRKKLCLTKTCEHIGDKLILLLNLSNNYGLNWVKSFILLFISNVLFFVLITVAGDSGLSAKPATSMPELNETISVISKNSHHILLLLIPTTDLKDLFKENVIPMLSGWVYLWFILQKIAYAYLAFQTITAFRKHLK